MNLPDEEKTVSHLSRRSAIKKVAALTTGATFGAIHSRGVPGGERNAAMAVTVRLKDTIGTIKPALYSQFAEHIGGVLYDGIWVGPDSKIANVDGIRRTLIDHVKQLG